MGKSVLIKRENSCCLTERYLAVINFDSEHLSPWKEYSQLFFVFAFWPLTRLMLSFYLIF